MLCESLSKQFAYNNFVTMYADNTSGQHFVGKKSIEAIGIEVYKFINNAKRIIEADNLKVNNTKTDCIYFSPRSLCE